jgi:type IV pilus assembly protein PilX
MTGRRERGAALAVALILLLVLTILAFTGMSTATLELTMSGNEQYRRNAAQAASAGIEQAISRLGSVSTVAGSAPTIIAPTLLPESTTDRWSTSSRYLGDETGLPQSSADKFIGLHYEIESTGTSARNARDLQTQGVLIVAATGSAGNSSFARLGEGLE